MTAATEQFQPAGSNLGQTIRQSLNHIRGKNVSTYTLLFLDPSSTNAPGSHKNFFVPNITFGRSNRCHVRYGDQYKTVSREHASLTVSGNQFVLNHNPNAKNPTLVNGAPIGAPHMLKNGDEIQFSYDGPRVRFNVAQAAEKGKGLGVTARIGGALNQALAPYKMATRILSGLLIAALAFGGFNAYQNSQNKSKLAETSLFIDDLQRDADEANSKLEGLSNKNTAEAVALKKEIRRLEKEIEKTKEENKRNLESNRGSYIREKAPKENTNSYSQNEQRRSDNTIKGSYTKPQDGSTRNPESSSSETNQNETSQVVPSQTSENPGQADISMIPMEDIYYIVAKSVVTRSHKGREKEIGISKLFPREADRKGLWAGTGFLTKDKEFFTARHVLKPWRYDVVNKDYRDWNKIETEGGEVFVKFEAYNNSDQKLTFKSSDFTFKDVEDEYLTEGKTKKKKKEATSIEYEVSQDLATDYAYKSIRNKSGSLEMDPQKSKNIRRGTKLYTYGFSESDVLQSEYDKLQPLYAEMVAGQDGLVGRMINASGKSFGKGQSGSPVMLWDGNAFKVVGIVSGGTAGNAIILPVANIE